MFGPFKPHFPISSGLLWKIPWRLSKTRKLRQRKRLRMTCHALDRQIREIRPEAEMPPKDKYTVFDKKSKTYRKGIHFVPKFTKITVMNRRFPPGY